MYFAYFVQCCHKATKKILINADISIFYFAFCSCSSHDILKNSNEYFFVSSFHNVTHTGLTKSLLREQKINPIICKEKQ